VDALSRNRENPEELEECINKLAQTLNASAMIYLEATDYDSCYKLLKRAEGLQVRKLSHSLDNSEQPWMLLPQDQQTNDCADVSPEESGDGNSRQDE
jgi:hypothetical protein